ncbi:hypothetical protein K458DRAFT_418763 [Lentithecium fluviatile CBS 122367]|uniref:Uncharacterized protein n=1 Tax=Lentithecium fluviatile CBS 122367 TaxID=1168545 RepID=A0A6G1J0Q6_9PLEO|nr:hypothetical protein K458DRAFT_418763 [Lentithecium fluviatile CBS 122367]
MRGLWLCGSHPVFSSELGFGIRGCVAVLAVCIPSVVDAAELWITRISCTGQIQDCDERNRTSVSIRGVVDSTLRSARRFTAMFRLSYDASAVRILARQSEIASPRQYGESHRYRWLSRLPKEKRSPAGFERLDANLCCVIDSLSRHPWF